MQGASTTITAIKNLAYVAAFFLGLDLHSYIILGALMLIDLVLGTVRAGIVHGWRSVKSYKFIGGIVSKLLVLSVPLILVWAGRGAGVNLLSLGKGALSMLVLGEAYSILGNINSIRVGKDLPEFDVISTILMKVQSGVVSILSINREKV